MQNLPTPLLGNITAITISSPDLGASLKFYQMLGFKEVGRANWPFPWIQVSDGMLLIMLREGADPYLALTYYIKDLSGIAGHLRAKGMSFTQEPKPKDMLKKYTLASPDRLNISLVGITDGFSQPPGPGMLHMPHADYFDPSKYVNQTAGMFGELAHPVIDLRTSIAYWKLLGFKAISEFTTPYPWAILSDGLAVVGLHQTTHFTAPAITYFATDMRLRINKLKATGLTNYTDQGPANITVRTPEGQQIFLFQLGEEQENNIPKLADIPQRTIETERLLLKELSPEILTQLFRSYSDEDAITFLGLSTMEQLEAEKEKYRNGLSWYRATCRYFMITEKDTGKRIGTVGYHTWYTQHSRAEIGYDIHESLRGRGYMTEALGATIAHGFSDMGLNRIEAGVGTKNEPSLRLMEHFGFTREGVLRSHYCKNGVIEDSVFFSLLRNEYNK